MPVKLSAELTELRRIILTMGAGVEQRVELAIDSIANRNVEAAKAVRHGDSEIDQMEVDIEEECLKILALSHPVATDLRFVLAVLRINGNLERVGDHARSVAKRALDLNRLDPVEIPHALLQMMTEAKRMLSNALAALSDGNASLANRVRLADQRVDDLQKEVFAWAKEEIQHDTSTTEAAIDIVSVARKFERIADLSTNIAEDTIFLVEGFVVRHTVAHE